MPESLRVKALRLSALQAITGFELFDHDEAFSVEDEAMAWEIAAIAVQHLNTMDCYRAPSSSSGQPIYLAITELTRITH